MNPPPNPHITLQSVAQHLSHRFRYKSYGMISTLLTGAYVMSSEGMIQDQIATFQRKATIRAHFHRVRALRVLGLEQ